MPILVTCPHCSTRLKAPDATAGKRVRCPRCEGVAPVPRPDPEPEDELADEPAPRRPVREKPADRPTAPRRKFRDEEDEEEEERPRRAAKKGKKPARTTPRWPLVAGAAVVAAAAVVGVLAAAGVFSGNELEVVAEPPARSGPRELPPPILSRPVDVQPAQAAGDPFRPTDPDRFEAARWLDRRADALPPIPQDPERMRANREAYRTWYLRSTVEAFDQVGRTDAPWADKARESLRLRAEEMAAERNKGSFQARSASDEAFAGAQAAGCDDPLVRYQYHKVHELCGRFQGDEQLNSLRKVVPPLWESKYPDVRKLHAVHNLVVALPRAKGLTFDEEPRTWEERFWEVFERTCREDDPFTQEDVLLIAELREYFLMRTGGTREEAYKEVAEHLAKAGAPKYTQLAAKGGFLIRHGWDARGTGFADTVTEEGFRLLGERLAEAEEALTAAYELAPDRPEAPTQMLRVCIGRGHDRAEMEKWFERAMKADPDNMAACEFKLRYLHPKWYGKLDEFLGFGWQCVRTKNARGMLPLATVAGILENFPVGDRVTPELLPQLRDFYSNKYGWHLTDTALTVLTREHPEKTKLHGLHARLACVAGKFDVARREMAAVGKVDVLYLSGGFGSPAAMAFYREWAATGKLPTTWGNNGGPPR